MLEGDVSQKQQLRTMDRSKSEAEGIKGVR